MSTTEELLALQNSINTLTERYNTLMSRLDSDSGVTRTNHVSTLAISPTELGVGTFSVLNITTHGLSFVDASGRRYALFAGASPLVVQGVSAQMRTLQQRGMLQITQV